MPNLRSLDLSKANDDGVPDWNSPIDPFGSFPNTLTSLHLSDIPLYPSFLKLRTLKELGLHYYEITATLDTILNFVENNCSLESVAVAINFMNSPTNVSQRRAVIANRLRFLSVSSWDVATARTLISNIPLRTGAHLEIALGNEEIESERDNILSGIPTAHLPNLSSPTFMGYKPFPREIQLTGPNGSFSSHHSYSLETPFVEFSVLPLTSIRELRLIDSDLYTMFDPSYFPALKVLTFDYVIGVPHFFSALLSDPSVFPSLGTLGFLNCEITEELMGEFTRFASGRKNTTSAWLHHVIIVHKDGMFPSAASIYGLERHVSVVDVGFGTNLPTDLT